MRNRTAALALTPALLLATACAPAAAAGGPSSAPASPGAASAPGSASPPATTPASSPAAPPASQPGAGPSAAPARCRTGDLTVTLADSPGGGAAGSQYLWLVFTNTSARGCTLSGSPAVSWVTGASGARVNAPFRPSGPAPARFALAPGGAAHAQVRSGNPDMYGEQCRPVPVAGLWVAAPQESTAVFVPRAARACSAEGVGVGEVWPLVPGLAE